MVEQILVSVDVAKLAEEKGFDVDTIFGYSPHGKIKSKIAHRMGEGDYISWDNKHDKDLRIPTYYTLREWLRNEKFTHITIGFFDSYYSYTLYKQSSIKRTLFQCTGKYVHHREALEAALMEALNTC